MLIQKKVRNIDYIFTIIKAIKIIKGLNDELNNFSIEVDLLEELIKIYDILSLNEKLEGDKFVQF